MERSISFVLILLAITLQVANGQNPEGGPTDVGNADMEDAPAEVQFSDAMVRLLPITNQQNFTATETKLGFPTKVRQMPMDDIETTDVEEVVEIDPKSICAKCSCAMDPLDNPYRINCMALLMNEIPSLDLPDPDITNAHLEFDNNIFEVIPLIETCDAVDSISFRGNQIHGIEPFAFAELTNLKRLDLSHNQLESIHPSAFHMSSQDQFSSIEFLDLSFNSLNTLESNLFEYMYNLVELNLRGNQFGFLDSPTVFALNSLISLQQLNLSENFLTSLPMELSNPMNHLEVLDLQGNQLTEVPEVLIFGGKLVKLVLSSNPIEELDAASFIELWDLQILEISNMPKLTIIHKGTFHPLKALTTLRINDNFKLHSIELGSIYDEYGYGPINLKTVELRNNNLTSLNQNVFLYFHNDYVVLDVRRNPFNCTCELEWIQTEGAAALYLDDTRCWTPLAIQGMSFKDVDFQGPDVPCPAGELKPHLTFHLIRLTTAERCFFLIIAIVLGVLSLITIVMLLIHSRKFCCTGSKNQIYKRITLTPRNRPLTTTFKDGTSGSVQYLRQVDEDEFNEDV